MFFNNELARQSKNNILAKTINFSKKNHSQDLILIKSISLTRLDEASLKNYFHYVANLSKYNPTLTQIVAIKLDLHSLNGKQHPVIIIIINTIGPLIVEWKDNNHPTQYTKLPLPKQT